jgi:hypothetical protein
MNNLANASSPEVVTVETINNEISNNEVANPEVTNPVATPQAKSSSKRNRKATIETPVMPVENQVMESDIIFSEVPIELPTIEQDIELLNELAPQEPSNEPQADAPFDATSSPEVVNETEPQVKRFNDLLDDKDYLARQITAFAFNAHRKLYKASYLLTDKELASVFRTTLIKVESIMLFERCIKESNIELFKQAFKQVYMRYDGRVKQLLKEVAHEFMTFLTVSKHFSVYMK